MTRKPLGRGLGALIESTAIESDPLGLPEQPILAAPVNQIAPSPFQPRITFDEAGLEELERSIKAHGVIEPLIVRMREGENGTHYELIAGERRLRAARAAGLAAVPVIVRDLNDRAALETSIIENLMREELNPVEEGLALNRLNRDFGMSHEEIAERIGKSRPYVSNTLRMLELPPEVLRMIAQGELTAGQARPLLALPDADAQLGGARKIVAGKITARGAEALAAEHRRRAGGKPGASRPAVEDPNLKALVETLQRALKRRVRIVKRRGKAPGHLEMDYYDDNDLTALASTLMHAVRPVSAHSMA